jgi:hypothetical protein
MKVFQILNDICYSDITKNFPSIAYTVGKFPPNVLLVETPDYVFEGWRYDDTEDGEERFIKPIAPEGWVYDEKNGSFYPEDYQPEPTAEEKLNALIGGMSCE